MLQRREVFEDGHFVVGDDGRRDQVAASRCRDVVNHAVRHKRGLGDEAYHRRHEGIRIRGLRRRMIELLVDELHGRDAMLQRLRRVVDVAVLRQMGGSEAQDSVCEIVVLRPSHIPHALWC